MTPYAKLRNLVIGNIAAILGVGGGLGVMEALDEPDYGCQIEQMSLMSRKGDLDIILALTPDPNMQIQIRQEIEQLTLEALQACVPGELLY